jgi:hypothetical protein
MPDARKEAPVTRTTEAPPEQTDALVERLFAATIDALENYGWSVLHCLAVGLLDEDSAGTGTVIRPGTVRAYAAEAGFGRVEVLPIEHDFWRFYRLTP